MPNLLNVLLAEDDEGDVEVVKRLLSKSTRGRFQVEWADTLDGAAQALVRGGFDVVLLDLGLPGMRGLDGLRRLQDVNARVPTVIVTDQTDESVAHSALQEGAQDYLIKGNLTTDNLVRSVRYATERQSLICHVAEAQVVLENKNKRLAKLYRTAHRFVDNVSHEFRTPLTVIKEYVSIIKDGIVGGVSDEQRQMLSVVEDRADDLNTMVDDMLDVSKLGAGLLCVYRKRCQVAEIVARVRPALERKAATKKVDLAWDIGDGLPPICCDAEKAGRVLINLSVNGIKFCGQPGHVRISCQRCPDSQAIEFSVVDNGPGISPENQREIFRRFKQLGTSARGSTKGFGLGLSIARELAKANLGSIRVASTAGCGSTFSFTLPVDDPVEVLKRYLRRMGRMRNGPRTLSLVRAGLAESVTDATVDDLDAFISCLLRYNDLVLRVGRERWLLVLAASQSELPAFRRRVQTALDDANRNRVGGPLPDIGFELSGQWRVGQRKAMLAELRQILASQEAAHA